MTHYVSVSEPTNVELGDEWFNPSTNRLYKRAANNGVSVSWIEQILNRNVQVNTVLGTVSNVILGNTNTRSNIQGSVRINTDTGRLEVYYSNVWWSITDTGYITTYPITGGITLDEGTDVVHVFLESSFLNVGIAAVGTRANVLIVAGGGSGSGYLAAGGGAGGMLEFQTSLSAGPYSIIVGGGAAGSGNGANSEAFGITTVGGGRGSFFTGGTNPGSPGGSGGGGGSSTSSGGGGQGFPAGNGIPGQGNPGGAISGPLPANQSGNGRGGGGGGAGGPGETFPSYNGGVGRVSTISPLNYGTTVSNNPTPGGSRYFAGGGAGSNDSSTPTSVGGAGGGAPTGSNGVINTGGGGGCSYFPAPSDTSGGSGIVIVKYPKNNLWPNPLT